MEHLVQCTGFIFCIETAKTFIDENGIKANLATGAFNDVSQTQGQRQGKDEGLATGQGRRGRLLPV